MHRMQIRYKMIVPVLAWHLAPSAPVWRCGDEPPCQGTPERDTLSITKEYRLSFGDADLHFHHQMPPTGETLPSEGMPSGDPTPFPENFALDAL